MESELLCQCDLDNRRCHEGECQCLCFQCKSFRDRLAWLSRLCGLEDRLKADGIDPQDLADLVMARIWTRIEARIQEEAERLARRHVERFISSFDIKEKLAELLFQDMVDVAFGVQQGVKRNGRDKTGAGSTHRGGKVAFGTDEQAEPAGGR